MSARKIRWSKVYESSEEELLDFLKARNVTGTRYTADAFERCEEQRLQAATDIYLAEGSASFTVDARHYSMQPGDVIRLPAGTGLSISAGMTGCVWYEAFGTDL